MRAVRENGRGGLGIAVANRAVVTFNRRHFIRLHAESAPILASSCARATPITSGWLLRIDQSLAMHPGLENRLVRVNRPQQT